MKFFKNLAIAVVGGLLYGLLELCWRGWTHWSMILVGGLCFWLLSVLGRTQMSFLAQMTAGMAIITALELTSGLLLNRVLALGVWDYSAMPLQFMGQICLNFSLLWLPISAAGLLLARALLRAMGEFSRPIRWV